MKNKNDKRGKSPANFYDRIAEMLGKAAIPQTITVEAEGVSPETFSAAGITKRELYATVAMASLAHAIITTPPVGCAPVAEVLRNNPRPMPEQRIEANARLLAAAPDLLAALEIIVGIFEPDKLTPYRFAREAVDVAKQIIEYVYGADERNRPTNESPSNDAEFLEWLYVRLVGTHGENPNTDYMQNLKSIIEKLR